MECTIPLLLLFLLFSFCESLECGDSYTCPDFSTCCLLADGNWGCCPMRNAVCCDDHVHCCPDGMKCDIKGLQCVDPLGESSPLRKKSKALRSETTCPDKRSKCPSGSTCCLLVSGRYGCCPAVNATCCVDHMHCCPHGYNCDASGQRCIQEETFEVISSLRKHKSTPIRSKSALRMDHADENSVEDDLAFVRCGYGKACPAFSTCCEVVHDGRLHQMCCPVQNGVCCEDTCCPSGYHCRPKGRCEKQAIHYAFLDF